MLSGLSKLSDKIDRVIIAFGHLVTWLFMVIVLIGFYEVVMRYAFDAPTFWVHESTTFIVSISLLYGGVYCYSARRHICMTFLVDNLRPQSRWFVDLFVHICIIGFTLMMTYGAYLNALDAFFTYSGDFKLQTSGSAWDTPFPAFNKGFFFLSSVMLVILSVLHTAKHLTQFSDAMSGKQGESEC